MPRTADSSFSEVHLGDQSESETDALELDPEKPFRILMVGDFSGRTWRKNPPRIHSPRPIDRDNFEDVMAEMQVGLNLPGVDLQFRELEDFHPDHIYEAASALFASPERYIQHREPPVTAPATPPAATRPPSSGSLLDQILSEQAPQPEPRPREPVRVQDANDLAAFIARVSKGSTEQRPSAAQQQRAKNREALAGEVMRGILHHPRMQALEAAWRAVFLLVRGLDTDGPLKLYLLDVTLPELIAEMGTIHKELDRRGPFAVIAANYSFGQTELDAQALRRLSRLASSLGAPFLAEAHLDVAHRADPAWHALRQSPDAQWIGLAMPRFLLRLPYGKDTSAIDSFAFEEMPVSEHTAYLWGNPAFFCAHLIGKSFLAHGWNLNPLERRIDDLPMHVYHEDGEPVAKPCAEVLLTEHEATTLLNAGFMPLASLKYEPSALIVRFQSIARPVSPLAGLSTVMPAEMETGIRLEAPSPAAVQNEVPIEAGESHAEAAGDASGETGDVSADASGEAADASAEASGEAADASAEAAGASEEPAGEATDTASAES